MTKEERAKLKQLICDLECGRNPAEIIAQFEKMVRRSDQKNDFREPEEPVNNPADSRFRLALISLIVFGIVLQLLAMVIVSGQQKTPVPVPENRPTQFEQGDFKNGGSWEIRR